MKYLVINGPNLDLTGIRETSVYGTKTIDEINAGITTFANTQNILVDFFISNSEGEIIDCLHGAHSEYDGIVLNAGALAHYSYALHDAIAACMIPTVEVHMSNIANREAFRATSVISRVCRGTIYGFGANVYVLALQGLIMAANEQQQ